MPAIEATTSTESLLDQLRAAIATAETADRAYRAYMADDSDPDDRNGTVEATNAADAEVERLRQEVIDADEEREWEARIDGGQGGDTTFTACSLEDALEQAADWCRDGDWDTSHGTVYCDVSVRCELTDEEGDCTVSIDQPEPECTGSEHDWQSPHEIVGGLKENPGVQGHGGGVIIEEVCMLCGCARTTDTWAQRRDTGEQGLREVTYEAGKYADEIETYHTAGKLDAIRCREMRACAAYVLAWLRDKPHSLAAEVSTSAAERAHEVARYADRVYDAAPRRHEQRAVRLALWLAARNQAEADAAVLVAERFAARGRS